jgi:hypothetical protein
MIIASIDASRLVGVIRQFPGSTAVTHDSFLNEQLRLLVSSSGKVPGLVQVTPPFSAGVKGVEAKKQGEKAVSRDIARVYANPGAVWAAIKQLGKAKQAAGYWKLTKAGKHAEALALAQRVSGLPEFMRRAAQKFDGGAEHDRRRGRNGRVRGRVPSMLISDPSVLKIYHRKKRRNVGLLASSLPAAVGSKYGTLNGIPAWVKRHSSRYGYTRETRNSGGRTVFLGLRDKAISDMQRRFTYVLKYRLSALERQIPVLARKLEKKLQSQMDAV